MPTAQSTKIAAPTMSRRGSCARQLSELGLAHRVYSSAFATTDAGGGSGGTTRSMTIAAPVSGATSFNRPIASDSIRCGDLSVSISSRRWRLISSSLPRCLLHLLEAIAVLQQLDALPSREQQHGDEEHAQGHRTPLLLQPALVDLADDRVVPNVFLDGVFESF